MSSLLRLCCCAVAGLTQTALSQVILLWGLGSSCSQPLFEKDPSQIVGSGRNRISRPCTGFDSAAGGRLSAPVIRARAPLRTPPPPTPLLPNHSPRSPFV